MDLGIIEDNTRRQDAAVSCRTFHFLKETFAGDDQNGQKKKTEMTGNMQANGLC